MSKQTEQRALERERIEELEKLNEKALSFRYLIEDQVTDAISAGDNVALKKVLTQLNSTDIIDQLSKEEPDHLLRNFKNHLININTYCRIAAKNGGVLPLYLHLVSERFSMIIEDANSVEYLRQHVFETIFLEYCLLVNEFSTQHYSKSMTEVVHYITRNLTKNLTLTTIATKFDMHPVHLARKFKQETGNTFIGYINLQRVYLAKFYFHLGEYQLSEIANLSGFNSHSYFTKVFKKVTGETPSKYIKQLPINEKV